MCDTAEVHRTLHTYCRLLDEGRLEEMVAQVYTADAVDDRQRGEPMHERAEILGSEPAPEGSCGAADFALLGTYTDRLRRTAAGWLIEHRVVGALGPNGLAVGALPRVFAGFGGRT